MSSAWHDEAVARKFLDEIRSGIPYHADQVEILLQLVHHFRPEPRLLLDLGCGDGILSRLLLTRYPDAHALCLDHSEPMLARAREALAPFGDRCRVISADLNAPIRPHVPADGVDLVVSSYAIHHLPDERKRSLYVEIHALLAPGGLFVNIEHVASPTPALAALWDARMIDHVAAHTGRPRREVEAEFHRRPDKADNILASVETQLAWLREAGFEHVDCYFKWMELAVFGGVKSRATA